MPQDPFTIRAPVLNERALQANPGESVSLRSTGGELRDPTVDLVLSNSPIELRRAVRTLARYFKNELGYDDSGYRTNLGPETEAWLLTTVAYWPAGRSGDVNRRAIGHALFRQDEDGWRLENVWIHPYFRRRGLLSAAWPVFVQRYGHFPSEKPWSDAMAAFLQHVSPTRSASGRTA
jgi:hypothetical protein